MAPGLHRIIKRQAEKVEETDYEEADDTVTTTLATKIFGKHLHKVRITTTTVAAETEEGTQKAKISKTPPFIYRKKKLFLSHFSWGGSHGDASKVDGEQGARHKLECGEQDRREDGHSAVGRCGNFCAHPSHHPRHMRILHSTVLPQTTIQRWQEGHERRWFEIGTVTWIRL